jgi:DNA-binding transcriptional ArsR family regulator
MSWEPIRPSPTTSRGIAHPLRLKILNLLRADGPATATLLADRLGQSTGATSYHLRQLAQYGFVVDEPALGAGRERWWKAAHRGTILEGDIVRQAPAETEVYLRAVASLYADRMDRWLSERAALPDEWDNTSTLSDQRLRLTRDEARELHREINALIERYRRDDPDVPGPPGAERVVVQWQLMPFLRAGAAADSVEPAAPTRSTSPTAARPVEPAGPEVAGPAGPGAVGEES